MLVIIASFLKGKIKFAKNMGSLTYLIFLLVVSRAKIDFNVAETIKSIALLIQEVKRK